MTTYQDADAEVRSSGDEGGIGARDFEQITRNKAVYDLKKHDYSISGWIVFPEYDMKELEIYVEDEAGNQYKKVKFLRSKDVYEYLIGTEYETEDSVRCRFKTGWDVEEDTESEDTNYYLSVYQDGDRIGRVQMMKSGFDEEADIYFTGALDTYVSKRASRKVITEGEKVVGRLNSIGSLYKATGRGFFYVGLAAYAGLTVVMVLDLRKKRYDKVNAWLIATGFGLSVIVFSMGIAVIHLTQCPAISEMYLSSAYAVLIGAELISILKCVEILLERLKNREKQVQEIY